MVHSRVLFRQPGMHVSKCFPRAAQRVGHKVSGCDETEGNAEKFSGKVSLSCRGTETWRPRFFKEVSAAVLLIQTHIFVKLCWEFVGLM